MKKYVSLLLMSVSAISASGFNAPEQQRPTGSNFMVTTAQKAAPKKRDWTTANRSTTATSVADIKYVASQIINDISGDPSLIRLLVEITQKSRELIPYAIFIRDLETKKGILNGVLTEITHTQVSALIEELNAQRKTPLVSRLTENLRTYRDALPEDTARAASPPIAEPAVANPLEKTVPAASVLEPIIINIVNDVSGDASLIALLVKSSQKTLALTPSEILMQDSETKKRILNGVLKEITHTQVSALIEELNAQRKTPLVSRLMENLRTYRDALPEDTARAAPKPIAEPAVAEPQQGRLEDGAHTLARTEGKARVAKLREKAPKALISKASFNNVLAELKDELMRYDMNSDFKRIEKYGQFLDAIYPDEFTGAPVEKWVDDTDEENDGIRLNELLIRLWVATANEKNKDLRMQIAFATEEINTNIGTCLQGYTSALLDIANKLQ